MKHLLRLFLLVIPVAFLASFQMEISDKIKYDWVKFSIDIDANLFESQTIDLRRRSALRLEAREQMLRRSTMAMESLVIDRHYTLGELLRTNRELAQEYSIFLEELQLGGVFFQNQKIIARISIPLRGDKGVLSLLPLPWHEKEFAILMEPESPGEGYQGKRTRSEFPRSLAAIGYSGLVIDMRDFQFSQSLTPRVFDETGYLIYGPEYLHPKIGIPRGIAGYAHSLDDSIIKRRVGEKYLYVSGLSPAGRYNSDAVLLQTDVEKIFEHPDTIENLAKTRVIFLLSKKEKL